MKKSYSNIIINDNDLFYRGSTSKDLTYSLRYSGIFFSDQYKVARNYAAPYILTVKLQAKNPLVINANDQGYEYIDINTAEFPSSRIQKKFLKIFNRMKDRNPSNDYISTDQLAKISTKLRYDALIILNVYEGGGDSPKGTDVYITNIEQISVIRIQEYHS